MSQVWNNGFLVVSAFNKILGKFTLPDLEYTFNYRKKIIYVQTRHCTRGFYVEEILTFLTQVECNICKPSVANSQQLILKKLADCSHTISPAFVHLQLLHVVSLHPKTLSIN